MKKFEVKRYIRTVDDALSGKRIDPDLWESSADFGEWAIEKARPGEIPRAETAEAFVGSFLMLELLETHQPARYDPRLFTAELVGVAIGFCHPIIRAMYTVDLLEHVSDERRVWQQVDEGIGDGLTHEQEFVRSVRKASPALTPFFRLGALMKFANPLLRQAVRASPIVDRIVAAGHAPFPDKGHLDDAFELRLNFSRHEDAHVVSLADGLAGRSADRTISHLLRAPQHDELEKIPAQDPYKADMVRLISAVRTVNAGDLAMLRAVMESTHYFTGESRSRWLGAIAERSTKDARSLHVFGNSLRNLKYKKKQREPQGEWSLDQNSRRLLSDWYSNQGKRIAEAVKIFRRWIRKTGQRAAILTDDKRAPEIRAEMGALAAPLASVKDFAQWIDAASNDLFPYELAIATWLSGRGLLKEAVGLPDIQRRARQAWREIQPDRIDLKRG